MFLGELLKDGTGDFPQMIYINFICCPFTVLSVNADLAVVILIAPCPAYVLLDVFKDKSQFIGEDVKK